jgi:dolichyl-diphosphooligosaccharide--protein glycosyltransferase
LPVSLAGVAGMAVLMALYLWHAIYAAREAYSATGVVLASPMRAQNATRSEVLDDFREAYSWLRANTREDAKVAAWWDYG